MARNITTSPSVYLLREIKQENRYTLFVLDRIAEMCTLVLRLGSHGRLKLDEEAFWACIEGVSLNGIDQWSGASWEFGLTVLLFLIFNHLILGCGEQMPNQILPGPREQTRYHVFGKGPTEGTGGDFSQSVTDSRSTLSGRRCYFMIFHLKKKVWSTRMQQNTSILNR